MLLSQDCLLKKKQTKKPIRTGEKTCKHQTFCSYCDWDVTLQIKQILTQTYLHKCIRITNAALCFLAFLCQYMYEADTNLPLFEHDWKPIRQEYSSQMSQKSTFGRVSSAQPEHDFSHLAVATMSIPLSPLGIRSYPHRNFTSCRNQRVPESNNDLCLITVNNGSQNPQLGTCEGTGAILSNKALVRALDRLERIVKKTAE